MASDIIGTGLVTSDEKVIGIECLPEMNLVAIATRNGEFLSCNSITVEVSDCLFMLYGYFRAPPILFRWRVWAASAMGSYVCHEVLIRKLLSWLLETGTSY